jgi:hypothetical protein
MADIADMAEERAEPLLNASVMAIRRQSDIPVGVSGECHRCGEPSDRLIKDHCARCRDLLASYELRNGRK